MNLLQKIDKGEVHYTSTSGASFHDLISKNRIFQHFHHLLEQLYGCDEKSTEPRQETNIRVSFRTKHDLS